MNKPIAAMFCIVGSVLMVGSILCLNAYESLHDVIKLKRY